MAKRKIIPYDPKLKELARQLRNDSTKTEIFLWLKLKGKQMYGYDFHRQKPIDHYILDFFSFVSTYTFSFTFLPKIPAGRIIKMTIKTPYTNASL